MKLTTKSGLTGISLFWEHAGLISLWWGRGFSLHIGVERVFWVWGRYIDPIAALWGIKATGFGLGPIFRFVRAE